MELLSGYAHFRVLKFPLLFSLSTQLVAEEPTTLLCWSCRDPFSGGSTLSQGKRQLDMGDLAAENWDLREFMMRFI